MKILYIVKDMSYNMTDIQASLGIHQIKRVNRLLARRKIIWERYVKELQGLPLELEANTVHSRHLFTILLELEKLKISRDKFLDLMAKSKIGTGVHYIAVHLHPYYRKRYGYERGDFPAAEFISSMTVSLPLSAKLSDKDVSDVIGCN